MQMTGCWRSLGLLAIASAVAACRPDDRSHRGDDPAFPDSLASVRLQAETLQATLKGANEATRLAAQHAHDSLAKVEAEQERFIKRRLDSLAKVEAEHERLMQRRLDSLARESKHALDSVVRQNAALTAAGQAQTQRLQQRLDSLARDTRRQLDSVTKRSDAASAVGQAQEQALQRKLDSLARQNEALRTVRTATTGPTAQAPRPPAPTQVTPPPLSAETEALLRKAGVAESRIGRMKDPNQATNQRPPALASVVTKRQTELQQLSDGAMGDWRAAADLVDSGIPNGYVKAGAKYLGALRRIMTYEQQNGSDSSTQLLRSETNRRFDALIRACAADNIGHQRMRERVELCPKHPEN
jgi:hypothetical protein